MSSSLLNGHSSCSEVADSQASLAMSTSSFADAGSVSSINGKPRTPKVKKSKSFKLRLGIGKKTPKKEDN